MTKFVFYLVLLWLFVAIMSAYEQCDNDRACPRGYTCNWDGTLCCQNSTCNVRSSWSLLSSDCRYSEFGCRRNMYCAKKGGCFSKEISMCDNYLELESVVGCGSEGYLINQGFEMCNRLYRNASSIYKDSKYVMLICTENCIQESIGMSILDNEKSCSVISQQAFGNYSVCFAKCGGCFSSKSWSLIYDMLDNVLTDLIYGFAVDCAKDFRKATDEVLPSSLAKMAKSFINLAKDKKGVDLSPHFMEFTSQNNTYNIGYVCEFRRNNFNLSCLKLSLITVTILILTLIAFVCVYQSALRSNLNRSGQGRIVELTPLSNNR